MVSPKSQFPILIAEDDFIPRRLLEKSLIEHGHEVTAVENGREALEAFGDRFYPILLTDWIMPEMDGLSLCRAVREKITEGYVFIILLTAKDTEKDVLLGFEAGADDYLTKPFEQTELMARINTGIRILKLEKSQKEAEKEIRQYSERLEDMVQERTEQLRKSEEKYRTILENIEEGYYEVDLSGNLTFCNDSLCRISGISRSDLIGKSTRDLADEYNSRKLFDKYHQVFRTGVPEKGVDWALSSKSGDLRFLENSVSLIRDSDGKALGFRGIIRDVTERKELENELVEKRRLAEEASKAKSEFLANLSHEIRTPLNGIIGMTELAMETDPNDEQKNLLKTIDSEASSLYGLINNILDFSKIEARKMELEEAHFDLRVLVEDLANNTALRAKRKGLDFTCSISPEVPSHILGDPGRLRQVLTNLLVNALKFTHEGEINLRVELDRDDGDEVRLRFFIKDTGIGIPEEKQGIIFEDFTQADGSTTRKYGGTGLGTTISKQLVELMGGEIGLDSIEGKGSTFWFTIVVKKQKESIPQSDVKKTELKGLKVLLVHGNRREAMELYSPLESWGCIVKDIPAGIVALSLLKDAGESKPPYDLVISDRLTSDLEAFEMAKRIRTLSALNLVPIILLTPFGLKGDAQLCKEAGIDGYLSGMTKPDDLLKAIELVFEKLKMDQGGDKRPLVTRHTVSEERRRKHRILLVEDYPTNQQVALRHLQRAGYEVDLSENGRDAIEGFKLKHYDLILMDMQMPVMDGYEATRVIRAWGKKNNNGLKSSALSHRTPIIAMTANAMKGDRELCLEAGTDDYTPKPLRRKELLKMIQKWLKNAGQKEPVPSDPGHEAKSQPSKGSPENAPMDYERAVDEFEGDEEFLIEVLGGFLDNVRDQVVTIRQAISDGEAETVRKEAHSIKGGAANLTAQGLSGIAFELEQIGQSERLEMGPKILQRLEEEFTRLEVYTTNR